MARNYTLLTIKTLFGAASSCAHPTCSDPLIFTERGVQTVVAEIAHIRSEVTAGPRHDPTFAGDINGPDNLLLLCGKHHRAVDRHASTYTTAELLVWKQEQVSAGGGLPLDDQDVRHYRRLSEQERGALQQVARLAQRVVNAATAAHEAVQGVREDFQDATELANARIGPIYGQDGSGQRERLSVELSYIERQQWDHRAREAYAALRPSLQAAQDALMEEVAVLRMTAGASAGAAQHVRQAAARVVEAVGDAAALAEAETALQEQVSALWQVALGQDA